MPTDYDPDYAAQILAERVDRRYSEDNEHLCYWCDAAWHPSQDEEHERGCPVPLALEVTELRAAVAKEKSERIADLRKWEIDKREIERLVAKLAKAEVERDEAMQLCCETMDDVEISDDELDIARADLARAEAERDAAMLGHAGLACALGHDAVSFIHDMYPEHADRLLAKRSR